MPDAANASTSCRRVGALIALIGLLVAWLAIVHVIGRAYIEDDAFIHLEYARSVAHGGGFAFNGRVSYGDTSPAWVGILGATWVFVGDWVVTAKVLAIATTIFSLSVVGWFSTQPLRELRDGAFPSSRSVAFLISCLGIATNPFFAFWSTSGMEAIAAAGGIIIAVHLSLTANRSAVSAVPLSLVGTLPLLRPETILLLPFVACARGFHHFRNARNGSTSVHTGFVNWAIECFVLSLPVLCWSAYAVSSFGTIEPNTNAAKRLVGGQGSVLRILAVYAAGFGIAAAGFTVAWGAGRTGGQPDKVLPSALFRRPLNSSRSIAVLVAATLAVQAFYVLNNTAMQTRYAVVWGVVLYACAAHELCRMYVTGSWVPVRIVIVPTVIGQALFTSVVTLPYLAGKAATVLAQRSAYAAAVQLVPSDAPIAIYAIGQFAFETRHPIIDTGGITDVDVVRYFGDIEATLTWARDRGAQYYLGGTASAGREMGRWSVPSARWNLDPRKAVFPDQLLLTTLDAGQ